MLLFDSSIQFLNNANKETIKAKSLFIVVGCEQSSDYFQVLYERQNNIVLFLNT